MSVQIFGIRHHGPGSARSLRVALEQLRPDVVLVEGPPDAEMMIPLLAHSEMRPPVALLIYVPDAPRRAVYYPFAIFSPEWQALHFALTNGIPARFMDLPQAHQFARTEDAGLRTELEPSNPEPDHTEAPANDEDSLDPQSSGLSPRADPLGWLAAAAGYSDGERWWEHMVEHRRDGAELFQAILEAMSALRAEAPANSDPLEAQREAWMRQTIRAAEREGFTRVAVVCGAWHAPTLIDLSDIKQDAALLKGLPKVKVQATWVPWTHGRLAYQSGYGAGIESPGWYEHLWQATAAGMSPSEVAARWMTRVARLLREQDLDASAAHVIEGVRLAEALAALRDRSLPGLSELNEAARAVYCFGSDLPMRLIHDKLIVGEALGEVPAETPLAPLQHDLAHQQKRLRLPPEASWRDFDLDLRKPNDLDRSHLLHRLHLLGIPWGQLQRSGGGKGTFHEIWRLEWQPELTVALIEAGVWGNTIADAATAFARDSADHAADLPTLTRLVDQALLAELPAAIDHLMRRLQDEAALASDIGHLMDALPPLANVLRYGNVRKTDTAAVAGVIDGLVARICIGLPGACAALNDDAAEAMFNRLLTVNSAVSLLQNAEHLAAWYDVLLQLVDQLGLHGLLAGRSCRILLDFQYSPSSRASLAHATMVKFTIDDAKQRLSFALSTASAPNEAAAWIEGLLKDSGALLIHDDALWQIIDDWLQALPGEAFTQTLPLLRRTFATFLPAERRKLGERARAGDDWQLAAGRQPSDEAFDPARAEAVLPLVAQLLGLRAKD
jgi:hypothetical protein